MCASAQRRGFRVARIEACEPRIVMSADPVTRIGTEYFVEPKAAEVFPLALAPLSETDPADAVRARYGFTGLGQTVAVIDSGIAYDHTALGRGYGTGYRVVGGFDFTEERDYNPYDDGPGGSHGTHVAGIIGADSGRTRGVAPGVDFVALRVFNDQGGGQMAWVEEALRWVHQHRNDYRYPITTVNLSLGVEANSNHPPSGAQLEDELAQLRADGIFVAAAAGNSFQKYNAPGLTYPATSPYVVPVSSIDANGGLSYFTQRSDRVLAAPGRSILSSVPDYMGNGNGIADDYARYSGTSMATPYVAGAAALMRQAYWASGTSDVTPDTIYREMVNTADTIYDPATGQNYHRLNLTRAIDAIMSQQREPETDTPGLYHRFAGTFSLRNSNTSGVADNSFYFGPGGGRWIAIAGDWNGDGVKTIGLYNLDTATFQLRNSNAGGAPDTTFTYGVRGAGWQPIVGDWNGDGVDTVGLYNPATGWFYLRNANSSGSADVAFGYGQRAAGWQAIAGDWNGDGVTTVGLFNPRTGNFYLRNTNTGGFADVAFAYGPAGSGWTPVAGDWNGDGRSSIGLFDSQSGTFLLRNANSTGVADSTPRIIGGAGWQPVVGDWNGRPLIPHSLSLLPQDSPIQPAAVNESFSMALAQAAVQASSGQALAIGGHELVGESRFLPGPDAQRPAFRPSLVEQRFDQLWQTLSRTLEKSDSVDDLDLLVHTQLRTRSGLPSVRHDLAIEQLGEDVEG